MPTRTARDCSIGFVSQPKLLDSPPELAVAVTGGSGLTDVTAKRRLAHLPIRGAAVAQRITSSSPAGGAAGAPRRRHAGRASVAPIATNVTISAAAVA